MSVNNILNINEDVYFDSRLVKKEIHSHYPYLTTSYNYNDEIRIPVQQQDNYTLPSESFIYIEGVISGFTPTKTWIDNNGFLFLFSEIRYELCGIEIDASKRPGVTSLMKNYVSFDSQAHDLNEISGWHPFTDTPNADIVHTTANSISSFNVCIPLNKIIGFAEDYRKILVNVKQELILRRANNDKNVFYSKEAATAAPKIDIKKVVWKMPYITLADMEKYKILQHVQHNSPITMAFRNWDLYEHPSLPTGTSSEIWLIKSSTLLERPRFLIFGFQTGKKEKYDSFASRFDTMSLKKLNVYLNQQKWPYDDLNVSFTDGKFTILYDMMSKFREVYYDHQEGNAIGGVSPGMSLSKFKKYAPLIFIDCSKQNETLKTGTIEVKVEIESSESFPADTSLFCLIIHDRIVTYYPLSNEVKIIM
uniref:Double jelly roll-like domain-containing protein n=1 Tax=Cacopsylla melanoneura TaxID=428564 RepID=A0A8D8Z8A6_9HEMI